MAINLRQMEVFRAVMLTGGVVGAAQLLHVSQPAVSKVLAQAQKQLGFALFARVRGRLVPTPEGKALHAEVEALWRGVERVHDVSRTLAAPRAGTLSIAVSANFAPYFAPRALALLADRFPGLRTRMEILIAPIMTDALLDESADIGVALLPNDHPNLQRVRNYQSGFACVAPPGHPLADKRRVTPADLVGHRVIGSPADTPYGQALQRAYGKHAAALEIHAFVRSAASACWQAQAGGGVAVVDRVAIAGKAFPGLVARPFHTQEKLAISVLRNRARPPSLVQEAFVGVFHEVWQREFRE